MPDDLSVIPIARVRTDRAARRVACALAIVSILAAPRSSPAQPAQGAYLYTLSNFGGKVPYDWAQIQVDRSRNEVYVVYQNLVRIFSASGMEIFSFGDDLDLGQLLDAAVEADGHILLLSFRDGRSHVTRCNFRGVPIAAIEITNLPDGLEFTPNRMVLRNGLMYFAVLSASRVIVTDGSGAFKEHIELLAKADLDEKQQANRLEISGFSVDDEGNIFFTVPVVFKAFKLTADRTLESFGRPGSAPGRFGIVAGIAPDSRGRLVVADKLRSVLMVFAKDFTFITEFGSRGNRPGGLVLPEAVAIDSRDHVYVTQGARRGVSVYSLGGN
jgi:hypothetical protein